MNKTKIKLPSHIINITIEGTPEEFWPYFEPLDLSSIFKKTRFLPAVKNSSQVDRWDTPGTKRTVYLESGDTAQEEIIACTKPNFFKYKVSDFTFSLKYLCSHAIGEWNITQKRDKTTISWTYTFYPKNIPLLGFILNIFIKIAWKEYMEAAMKNLTEEYDKYRKKNLPTLTKS